MIHVGYLLSSSSDYCDRQWVTNNLLINVSSWILNRLLSWMLVILSSTSSFLPAPFMFSVLELFPFLFLQVGTSVSVWNRILNKPMLPLYSHCSNNMSCALPLQTEDPLVNRTILYQTVALYDYAAQGSEDLEFSEGETIDILGEGEPLQVDPMLELYYSMCYCITAVCVSLSHPCS